MSEQTIVQLSLISHTNVGKTTLARTLLRRDIGEVRDAAHVTELAESHVLTETPEAKLLLWDTPGFGDTARLLRSLRAQESPLRWLLSQVWDRFADRPLWCSQQAARNVRDQADVVLYLVNAAETPQDAGYVRPELDLLSWIGRPVLLLLNQTGAAAAGDHRVVALEESWRAHVALFPVVRDVLALDAFTRCWVEEHLLFERIAPLLDGDKRAALGRLQETWTERLRVQFESSVAALATYLALAARDRETLADARPSQRDKTRTMNVLGERLEAATRAMMGQLIALHELRGQSTKGLERRLDDLLLRGTVQLTAEKGALIGGALSGAVGGLTADLLAGGLTFGGGLLAGAILGALGGAGLSRAHELVRLGGEPRVGWSPAFLDQLVRQALLRYLAVAHFGRGRGEFRDDEQPAAWMELAATAVDGRAAALRAIWKRALAEPRAPIEEELRPLVRELLEEVLIARYPAARSLFERRAG